MTRISQINYEDAIVGRIKTWRSIHPIVAWAVARGATDGGSNEFVDPNLTLSEDHFENVLRIIRSARRQDHHGVEVRLTPESLTAIASRIAEISALEDVEIETRFYREYLGREQIIVMFRERRADWLLNLARQRVVGR